MPAAHHVARPDVLLTPLASGPFPCVQTDEVDIDIILSPTQALSFRERINADGTDARAIDGALDGIESAQAETSVPADTESIRSLIQGYAGGFGTLNDTVKRYLRRWFVSQGGVKTVARRAQNKGRPRPPLLGWAVGPAPAEHPLPGGSGHLRSGTTQPQGVT